MAFYPHLTNSCSYYGPVIMSEKERQIPSKKSQGKDEEEGYYE